MTTGTDAARPASVARVRLLEIVDGLFYRSGIHQVGVDRIIAEAGVTKATFYKQFGSKDALILEYVQGRDRRTREALTRIADDRPDHLSALAALVDAVVAWTAQPDFRGDPFINAAAEFPDPRHAVRLAVLEHREWVAEYLEDLLRGGGHPQAGAAADEFSLLRDGALTGAYAGDPIAATSAFVRGARRIIAEAAAA